jgi:competence protein ComEC
MAHLEPDSTEALGVKALVTLQRSFAKQADRLMLWCPLFLIIGIWTYFNLPTEPSDWAVVILGLALLILMWFGRQRLYLIVIAMICLGFVVAKLRQDMVATPLLRAYVSESQISGYVADADNRGNKKRILVVELDSATHIPDGEMPRRVRLSTYNAADVLIGDYVSMNVRLSPLPRPVAPGAFDYGRMLYFQSIGATGQSSTEPTIELKDVPYRYVIRRFFHNLRSGMGERITNVIPGPIGAFANAVITGERAAIPKEMNTSLQISGLAHILSISGLHMTLVAGGVFWSVRAFLALFPFLALQFPIKKWAACAALFVGLIYMLLADSGSATERSYIMIAVMFFAMIVDRPAVSLRNLAISAILILLVTPEESLGASFQMSFLAVMGLAAFFEWWNQRPGDAKQFAASRMAQFVSRMGKTLAGSVLTTLVAGGMSSIAAAYHFGRMAPYGTIANGLSLPVVSLVVMPSALLSAVLMPFGLEKYPLKLMELGLQATMWISDLVSTWPNANMLIVKPALSGIILMVMGAAILCIGAGRLRFAGVVIFIFGLFTSQWVQRPQILIEERASNVAVLDLANHYIFASEKGGKFAADKWLQDNGEITTLVDATNLNGWTCEDNMCFSDLAAKSVAFVKGQKTADWTCPPVEILIADFPLRRACPDIKTRIDRFDVWRQGAHAIYISGDNVEIKTVKSEQGDRPWVYTPRARPKPEAKPEELPITAFSG